MQSPANTASQLREARHRIALLEQELAALRSTAPSPTPVRHPPSPRPSVMTRRASAAAAATTTTLPQSPSTPSPPLSKPPTPPAPHPTPSPAPSEVSRHISEQTSHITPLALTHPSPLPDPSATFPSKKDVRRRPPPLPAVKTASSKKDRVAIVAKCTEPRPGQTRYWTCEEHDRFLEAVAEYGEKAYVAISNYVETRTPKQVRTHAQKFQMKMARLARQSIDAGQPVRMPAGMSPVVQIDTAEGKPALVPLQPGPVGLPPVVSLPGHPQVRVPVVVAPPPSNNDGKKKLAKRTDPPNHSAPPAKLSPALSDENSSALTDPYMDYIGSAETKDQMELENTLAAKLCQTLEGTAEQKPPTEGELLPSDGSSNESASVAGNDCDDLEDLNNLEDQDLSFAAFTAAGDTWMPDVTV